ncbi:DUF4240 domain-containing protein [Dactylosporangium sp. McL0621]|uniref:DUF4240 domain-containing protein n=1 Tax=Dactylosporangium sp. McL0621 TaxID=3415678 RepID=UPI003CEE4F1A
MNVADFWRFLELSARETTDLRHRAAWLEYRLSRIATEHIVDFQIHLDTARRPIDTWDMLGAGNLIMDGLCGGDSFWYFQPWLIGQGHHWWQHAVRNPDNLADLPAVQALAGRRPRQWPDAEWPQFEDLAYVASSAYDMRTGEGEGIDDALGERGHHRPSDPVMNGKPWDLDSLAEIQRRMPKLSRIFPRHHHLNP